MNARQRQNAKKVAEQRSAVPRAPLGIPDEETLSILGPARVACRVEFGRTWFSVEGPAGRVIGDHLSERAAQALADRINLRNPFGKPAKLLKR